MQSQPTVQADSARTVRRAASRPSIPCWPRARRIQLDDTFWAEYVPGWMSGSELLLASLLANTGGKQRDRWMINRTMTELRLTSEYTQLAEAPDPFLRKGISSVVIDPRRLRR